jgi:ABC-type nitrate/sulfonate/bicarbonate transport system permease component
MKKSLNIKNSLPPVTIILALLLLWELICKITAIPEFILPSPSAIGSSLAANYRLIASHSVTTLAAVAAGLFLAVTVAVLAALAMDRWLLIKQAMFPLLVVSQAVPIFALAPLMLIWFGVGLAPKILIVALVCFFPLAVSLVEGLEQVNPEEIELMQVMQAGRWMIMQHVKFPAALPYFFSGLKIAATYSVLGAIIGEWLGARAGLGIYMLRAKNSFQTSDVFASIIIVVVLSLLLFKIVEITGSLVMPWRKEKDLTVED